MGTAGMGDALTGVIGSFLAQGFTPIQAAIQGIYYHGKAGDIVKQEQGETARRGKHRFGGTEGGDRQCHRRQQEQGRLE